MSSTLACHQLCFSAGGHMLLGPCDLGLADHGVTAVLGANGAGKTLLLKLLHGLLRPSSGTVTWGGADGRPRQTMVLQQPVMLRRSVLDNLAIVPVTAGDRGQPMAALRWAGLAHCAEQRADLLSPGIQQQVALARARLYQPAWLFLDEPTASLDPAASERVEAMIGKLVRDGVRIVFSSHNLAQVRRLADSVVFLDQGKADAYDRAEAFFTGPHTQAAATFLELERV